MQRIGASAARDTRNVPVKFTLRIQFQSPSEVSSAVPGFITPALFTTTFSAPNFSATVRTA